MRYLLYLDSQDGPSQSLRGITRYFEPQDLCSDNADLMTMVQHCQTQREPVTVFFVMPQSGEPWCPWTNRQTVIQQIQDLCGQANYVVLCITELLMITQLIDMLTQIPNLWIMTPGQHNHGPDRNPFVCWQHWIQDLVTSWNHPAITESLQHIAYPLDRPYVFDVLLGGERTYRTLLHDLIASDSDLRSRVLMSYYGHQGPTSTPHFIYEPGMDPMHTWECKHTGQELDYLSVRIRAACIAPISVYQQTWFTVLTETSAHSAWNFYTEKVAKPLALGRLFFALGGQHYLRGLRESGFQTFHGIIDESYDQEPNDTVRLRMMFHEMRRVAQQNPQDILALAQPRIEHNRELAWSQDWMALAVMQAQNHIVQHHRCCPIGVK
jgi:hypothetical protein